MSTQPTNTYTSPSRQDLMAQISSLGPSLRLYRASNDWWAAKYQGEKFWFPPDLGGHLLPHPQTGEMVPADGVHSVRSRVGMLYTESKLGQPARPTGMGVRPGMNAPEIAAFLLDRYGNAGVVMLTGVPDADAAAKEKSRSLVYKLIKAWADKEVAARSEFVQKFQSKPENKGKSMPAPTEVQRRAQEWLDSNALSQATFTYNCEYGCYATNDYELFRRHMKASHSKDLPPTPAAPEPLAEETAAEAVQDLIAQAEADLKAKEAELSAREAALAQREINIMNGMRVISTIREREDDLAKREAALTEAGQPAQRGSKKKEATKAAV